MIPSDIEKLRLQYLSKLKLTDQQFNGSHISFKEKLKLDSGEEMEDIFEKAFTLHRAHLFNGHYQNTPDKIIFSEFVYLFDNQIRSLLQTDNRELIYWAKSYLIHYYSDFCESYKLKSILKDEDERKSCFTDAFIDFFKKTGNPGYQFNEKISLKSFFFSIFHKKCVDLKRKKTAKKNSPNLLWANEDEIPMNQLSVDAKALVEPSIFEIAAEHLQDAIREMGGNCEKIISRFHFNGWSLEEISDQMGMTLNSIKTTKSRCMQKLREIIKEKMKVAE